jgi:transcriptional regulator with XRE-family HTH domain
MTLETANRLYELRKKNNLSQEELAEKLGVSRQAVSKWERSEASPDTDNLIGLAKIYGLSLDELIYGKKEEKKEETQEEPKDETKEEKTEDDGNKKKNLKAFFLLSALLAIVNGLYGVVYVVQNGIMTDIFKEMYAALPKEEMESMVSTAVNQQKQMLVIYSFAGAAIIAAIRLILAEKKKVHLTFVQTKKSLLYLILAAVVSAMAVNCLVLLVGIVNETLLYTFDNAGVMLLSALASALIFKDKLSTKNIIGCVVMTLALIMMGSAEALAGFIFG